MAQHARLINGRLLLAGRRPWHEWPASDLLDICDVFREEEIRFVIGLKVGGKIPTLPDVDTSQVAIRTPAGFGYVYVDPPGLVDDGSWGMDEDSWEPSTGPAGDGAG